MNGMQKEVVVRDVWASNLSYELSLIHMILPCYRFVSFDTEFPGVVFPPKVDKHCYSKLSPSENYLLMKANVDSLKIIQIGLTFSDITGTLPDFGTQFCYVWQFNFQDFNIERDLCNTNSILLLQKQGIDFFKNRKEGIPSCVFRMFVLNSGLLFNRYPLTWVTFHSSYDFGFLIKILIGQRLPSDIDTFRILVYKFFGSRVYDMKHIMKFCKGLYGGLEKVAKTLNVDRIAGKSHQAGSDSLLTLQTFMKLKDVYFNGDCGQQNFNLGKFQGVLYGFEVQG